MVETSNLILEYIVIEHVIIFHPEWSMDLLEVPQARVGEVYVLEPDKYLLLPVTVGNEE